MYNCRLHLHPGGALMCSCLSWAISISAICINSWPYVCKDFIAAHSFGGKQKYLVFAFLLLLLCTGYISGSIQLKALYFVQWYALYCLHIIFCAKSQKDVHISLVPCTHKLAHILTNYPAVQHKCIIGLYCAAHILCMCNAVHAQHCLMPYIVHHISLVCNNAW